jgi:glycosyltransferase involved in cell wall biosynthesis
MPGRNGLVPVTVVIPVKNESRNVVDCIHSAAGLCEIIVVDSGSTDATVPLARQAGATVLHFEWNGTFPKKRNWVLQTHSFKTPWVLFLDADERLTPKVIEEIGRAVIEENFVGYWLRYDLYFMGRLLRHGVKQRKLALFRVHAGGYERIEEKAWSGLDMEIHEHPILVGEVGEIRSPLKHLERKSIDDYLARHRDYADWEASRFLALSSASVVQMSHTWRQRLKYGLLDKLYFAPGYFLVTYILRGGFLDGHPGFVYAFLKMMYFFQVRLKILERRSWPPSEEMLQ